MKDGEANQGNLFWNEKAEPASLSGFCYYTIQQQNRIPVVLEAFDSDLAYFERLALTNPFRDLYFITMSV